MRTNIDIDDELMARAMQAGPFKTKREAVEAGLKLLARQAAYREILKWEGKLKWEGDESIDWTKASEDSAAPKEESGGGALSVQESSPPSYEAAGTVSKSPAAKGSCSPATAESKRRARR
jgi:Arc/MetJ family transcription regulator